MICSCIKGKYDFVLQSLDCSRLLYNDLSDWMVGENYDPPSNYDVHILVPGRKNFVSKTVKPNSVTVITTEDLGLKSKCITDGIYCFKVDNCGTIYQKNKAVTYRLQCCIDNLVITASTQKDLDTVKYLQMMIDGIHINSEHGNINEAVRQFEFVSIALDSINCQC